MTRYRCSICGETDYGAHALSACPGGEWAEVPWSREEVAEALGETWTLTDFAAAIGVSRGAPANWSHRFADFPTPLAHYGKAGIYYRPDLLA